MNDRTIKIIAWKQAINYSSVLLLQLSDLSPIQNLWDKQQQQASRENEIWKWQSWWPIGAICRRITHDLKNVHRFED